MVPPYPAEIFTMVTGTFFEKFQQQKRQHNNFYKQFKKYYVLDPRQWTKTKHIMLTTQAPWPSYLQILVANFK